MFGREGVEFDLGHAKPTPGPAVDFEQATQICFCSNDFQYSIHHQTVSSRYGRSRGAKDYVEDIYSQ